MSEIMFNKFEDGRQIVFDPSSLSDAEKCLFYYKTKTLDRWRSKGTLWNALFGTLVHECLEVYHITKLESGHAAAQWSAFQRAVQLAPQLAECPDTSRTPNTLLRAVSWYTEQWGEEDPFKTVRYNDSPAIEIRFEVAIPDTPWRMSGRIDRLASWQNELFIVDTKTTGRVLNTSYWNSWHPSTQFTAYRWAARELGLDVRGTLVEACQTMVNGTRWARHRIDHSEAHLDEFAEDLFVLVHNVDACHVHGRWPRNRSSCTMYGGCEFRDVCAARPSLRQNLLEERFDVVPYEPPATTLVEEKQ